MGVNEMLICQTFNSMKFKYKDHIAFQNTFYSDCIINDGPYCDRFIEEECEYRGKVVYRPKLGSITDFDHCAQMCKIYKSSNCNYWVYHEAWLECILYDTSERVCKSISGPEHPDIKGCEGNQF